MLVILVVVVAAETAARSMAMKMIVVEVASIADLLVQLRQQACPWEEEVVHLLTAG